MENSDAQHGQRQPVVRLRQPAFSQRPMAVRVKDETNIESGAGEDSTYYVSKHSITIYTYCARSSAIVKTIKRGGVPRSRTSQLQEMKPTGQGGVRSTHRHGSQSANNNSNGENGPPLRHLTMLRGPRSRNVQAVLNTHRFRGYEQVTDSTTEKLPANNAFPDRDYIIVGIIGRDGITPKEIIVPVPGREKPRGKKGQLFRELRKAEAILRPFWKEIISLKSVSGLGIYECFPAQGFHAPVEIDQQTRHTLNLLYSDYRSNSPRTDVITVIRRPFGYDINDDFENQWLEWIKKELNADSKDPEDGKYALQLLLHWSIPKFLIWGMTPILLSLAIGFWYMFYPREGDPIAIVQTAWTISSYVVTASALIIGLLAAITQFGHV